jgi:hypothetical protein
MKYRVMNSYLKDAGHDAVMNIFDDLDQAIVSTRILRADLPEKRSQCYLTDETGAIIMDISAFNAALDAAPNETQALLLERRRLARLTKDELIEAILVGQTRSATLTALLREAVPKCDIRDCTSIATWVHLDDEFFEPSYYCCDEHHDRTDEVAYDLGCRIKAALEE